MNSESYSVLVVTKDPKISSLVSVMLMAPMFELVLCSDLNEARRKANEKNYSIILVDSGEGEGTDFAVDISDSSSVIMLMVNAGNFDQISYRVESYGIITLTKPFDQFYFYNMIKVAIAVNYKIRAFSSQTMKLKEKMEEIRLINRAKMLLMEKLSMTEEQSHHYIEKEAMDRCIKRLAIAREIINTYDN